MDIFINYNENERKYIKNLKFYYNKDLIYILFSLRIVLNTLSIDKNGIKPDLFFFNLIKNTNETISKNKNIFDYFFNDDLSNKGKTNVKNREAFMIIRIILLSHLLFAYILDNLDFQKFKEAIYHGEIDEEKDVIKLLRKEFDSIIELIRFKGVKSRYTVIYMNIIFDFIKKYLIDIKNIKEDKNIKYMDSRLKPDYFFDQIKKYFEILRELGINEEKMEMNESKKIIFEDSNYYKQCINNYPYLNYLTTPNFCTIEDFKFQYQSSSMNVFQIINLILNEEMDKIIDIINCLPEINKFLNKIFNKKIL